MSKLDGEIAQRLQGCRQCQKCMSHQDSEGCQERRFSQESENSWVRIAACEDRRGDNSHCSNCRCVRGYTACVHPCVLSHLEVCGKKRRSMCCHALCGCRDSVDVDTVPTWMLQDDRSAFRRRGGECKRKRTE